MEQRRSWTETFGAQPDRTAADAILDHRLDMSHISRFTLAAFGIMALGLGVRLIGFDNYPLSPQEAQLAYDARALLRGEMLSSAGLGQPLITLLTSFSFFLFGEGDGAARLVSLVAGLMAVFALFQALRRWHPEVALAASALAALSPVFTALATRLDGGAVMIALALALIVAAQGTYQPSRWHAAFLGALAGLLPLAHPFGWLVLILLIIWGALYHTVTPQAVTFGAAGMVLSLAIGGSFFFTHPAALGSFLATSFRALWNATLAHPFTAWHLPIFLVFTDELPAFIFALIGLAWAIRKRSWNQPLFRTAACWTLLAVLFAVICAEKSLTLYGLLTTPLTVLGAIGLTHILSSVRWRALLGGTDLALFGTMTLFFLASLSLIGRLIDGPGAEGLAWWLSVLSLALLVVALLLGISTLWRNATAQWAALVFIPVFLLLALDLRTSALLQATHTPRSGELLLADMPSPGLRSLANRIRQLSEDTTTFQADAQDPTGGHALRIGIDPTFAQPFHWYFRDFPNILIQAGLTASSRPDLDVLIDSESLASTSPFIVRSYPFSQGMAPAYASPDWKMLLASAVNPRGIKHYLGFLIQRQVATPAEPTMFSLGLKAELAQRLYGTTTGTSTTP